LGNKEINWQDRIFTLLKYLKPITFTIVIIAIFGCIYDFGFNHPNWITIIIEETYKLAIIAGMVSIILRYLSVKHIPRKKVWFIDGIFIFILLILILNKYSGFELPGFTKRQGIFIALLIILIREYSVLNLYLKKQYLNPALLFVSSFILVIFSGAFLLILPNATINGISFIDALFTATSAVCVTGLSVVDTGTYFTPLGQTFIVILIQLGGLGILTFTSYFTYFFKGESSYNNQLLLKDLTNTSKITEIFKTLKRIIITTTIIEGIGAILVFLSLDETVISSFGDRVFFSLFHSVSGFCNAGFSTLRNNLYELPVRYNYFLHLTIAFLIILGGIGFPIVFNALHYIKHLLINRLIPSVQGKAARHKPWVININTRIVVITTAILIVAGTLLFYVFEYNNTLAEHSGFGKIVTAFFGAVTPRTAGFNTVDTAAMNFYTIMMVFFLMWVGASPASTGGGIKTSTLAISVLNFISIAKGKDRIEIFRREISNDSVKRAFSTITLSFIVLGISIFLISYFDKNIDLRSIAFECFSALGTVGLSLGITAKLSSMSKFILVLTMLIGRVGMLTILIALFSKIKHLKYRYPTEDIIIN
jgi:trk system potassium uptake protein